MEVTIRGQVLIRSASGDIPAPNLLVQAWDKDLLFDDPLGEGTTGSEGVFQFPVKPGWEHDEIASPEPDVYLRIKINDDVISPLDEQGEWTNISEGDVVVSRTYRVTVVVAARDLPLPGNNGGNGAPPNGTNDDVLRNLRYLVAYQPTPRDAGGGGVRRASEIETTVSDALRAVLGKAVRRNDGRALQGALDHVFKFDIVEGHREVRFQPPTYTVTTDLGTELSGPQKSLYTFIESTGRELRQRIDALRPLKVASDSERTEPDRVGWLIELEGLIATIRNSINLRPLLVDGAFERLDAYRRDAKRSFGFRKSNLKRNIQSIDDEQVFTEYLNAKQFQAAMQTAWTNFKATQGLPDAPPLEIYEPEATPLLIGVSMAQLEELLDVVYESVDEVYIDLDALGIGEEERRVVTLVLKTAPFVNQKITVAELFDWVASFSKEKAPRILNDGGRSSLRVLYAEAKRLADLVAAVPSADKQPLPLQHPRVLTSIEALNRQLVSVHELLASSNQGSTPKPPPPSKRSGGTVQPGGWTGRSVTQAESQTAEAVAESTDQDQPPQPPEPQKPNKKGAK